MSAEDNINFPDLLSVEKLIDVLKKFKVLKDDGYGDSKVLSKEDMVELYRRFILPLPQRVQLKHLRNVRTPKDSCLSKQNCKSLACQGFSMHEDTNIEKKLEKVSKEDFTRQMPKDIVRIATLGSDKSKKPIKLKRNYSKIHNNAIHEKECKDKNCHSCICPQKRTVCAVQTSSTGHDCNEGEPTVIKDDVANRKRTNNSNNSSSVKPKLCKLDIN